MKASDWKHVHGSSEKSPECENCGPWIKHWKKLCILDGVKADAQKCAVYDCNNPASEGAHIRNSNVNINYIAPMCDKCNSTSNDSFTLKDKTVIVLANVSKSCGAAKLSSDVRVTIEATTNDYDKAKRGQKKDGGGYFY